MNKRFSGKTVVVTGGAAGLGRAHALAFAGEGAHLVLLDINEAGLAETRALIDDLGSTASIHRVDMSDEQQIIDFGKALLADHDSIDVLINNAGLHMGEIARGFSGMGLAKWQHFFTVNSFAPPRRSSRHWRRPKELSSTNPRWPAIIRRPPMESPRRLSIFSPMRWPRNLLPTTSVVWVSRRA